MSSAKLHVSSLVSRTVDLAFNKLDDEMLALDAQAGYCYAMNDSAGRIWELIQNPITVGDLCTQLGQYYSVDEKTCLPDVLDVLQSLREAGLLQVNNDSLS